MNYIVEYKKCEYLFSNPSFDPTIDENEITNKKFLGGSCKHEGSKITSIVIDDEKCYCYNHKKYVINKHNYKMKKDEKAQKIEAKKQAKIDKKNEEVNKRNEMNQKLAQMKHYFNEYELLQDVYIGELEKHKNLVKEEIDTFRIWAGSNNTKTIIPINEIITNFEMVILPNLYNQMIGLSNNINQTYESAVLNENTVVVPNVTISTQDFVVDTNHNWKQFLCTEILKTGKRKGLSCLNHKFEDNSVCKKHHLGKK